MDLLGTPVRVTSVDPGLVETEFSLVSTAGETLSAPGPLPGARAPSWVMISREVVLLVLRRPHVNVLNLVILPTSQASATLVHRSPD